ncbi:MAG: ABC transporter substrate-binding protein [Omnitrophica WOR_2 bacterium]
MKTKSLVIPAVLVILMLLASACSGGSATTQPPAAATSPASGVITTTQSTTAATSPASGVITTTQATATTAAAPAITATQATTATTGAISASTNVSATAVTAASNITGTVTCPLQVESGAHISFSGWGDPSEQKVYRDSIARFLAVCPGVSVDYIPIPSNFQDKMKAQMAGGTAPDVFYVDFQLMSAFAGTGQLLALDDLMKEAKVTPADFIPALMKEFQLDGKTYGLPKDWGTLGLIYLPEAFKQAGIPEPTDNWTWDDVHTAAKAIAAKGKYAGFCMGPDEARFAPMVFSNGGSYTTPDFKTATVNTPEVEQMATLVQSMVQDKSLVKPADISAGWCGEAIGKQLVGMTTEGGWMVNFMKQTYPNVDYKAVEIPKGPKTRADYVFTNAIGVNAATKYPKAAAALAIFITGRYNQGLIQSSGFAYSTHPDQIGQIKNPIDIAISKGGLLPDSKAQYWGPNTGKVGAAISQALERIFLGNQNVKDALSQAQDEVQSALGQ